MNKKVLIFFPHRLKQRHGGPYSMLFHLQQGLKPIPNQIHFLSSIVNMPVEQEQISVGSSSFKKLIKSLMPTKWLNQRRVKGWLREVNKPDKDILAQINVSEYAVLHFHETIDIWRYRSMLADFTGKIVLTSHSPKPYHLEVLEDVFKMKKKDIGEGLYKQLENIDVFAYQKAGHFVFPCKEATEPYLDCWPAFSQLLQVKNLAFVTTGVIPSQSKDAGSSIRQSLNIPGDAFVVTYVGRKLAVKGFDLLIDVAKALMQDYPNVYFIIVGKKEEENSFRHDRFIETGWTDDPFSYIEAGDLHVVPNRYTNFDLNVLEVLSLGKPLLLSNTGGNKYFKQFTPKGIFYHEPTTDDLKKQLINLFELKDKLKAKGIDNKNLYRQYFTALKFATEHIAFYKTILE